MLCCQFIRCTCLVAFCTFFAFSTVFIYVSMNSASCAGMVCHVEKIALYCHCEMDVCTVCSIIHILQQYTQEVSEYDDNHSQPSSVEVWRTEAEASPETLHREPVSCEDPQDPTGAQSPKEDSM